MYARAARAARARKRPLADRGGHEHIDTNGVTVAHGRDTGHGEEVGYIGSDGRRRGVNGRAGTSAYVASGARPSSTQHGPDGATIAHSLLSTLLTGVKDGRKGRGKKVSRGQHGEGEYVATEPYHDVVR